MDAADIIAVVRPYSRVYEALRGHKGGAHDTRSYIMPTATCSICGGTPSRQYIRKSVTVCLCERCDRVRASADRVHISFETTIRLINEIHAELPGLLAQAHAAFDRMLLCQVLWPIGEPRQRNCVLCCNITARRYAHRYQSCGIYVCEQCDRDARARVRVCGRVLTAGLFAIMSIPAVDVRAQIRQLFMRMI